MTLTRAMINERLEQIENLISTDVLAAAAIEYELKLEGFDCHSWFEHLAGSLYPLVIAETRADMEQIWGKLTPTSIQALQGYYRTGLKRLLDTWMDDVSLIKGVEQLKADLDYRLNQSEIIWAARTFNGWAISRTMHSVDDQIKIRPSKEINRLIGWKPSLEITLEIMDELILAQKARESY